MLLVFTFSFVYNWHTLFEAICSSFMRERHLLNLSVIFRSNFWRLFWFILYIVKKILCKNLWANLNTDNILNQIWQLNFKLNFYFIRLLLFISLNYLVNILTQLKGLSLVIISWSPDLFAFNVCSSKTRASYVPWQPLNGLDVKFSNGKNESFDYFCEK